MTIIRFNELFDNEFKSPPDWKLPYLWNPCVNTYYGVFYRGYSFTLILNDYDSFHIKLAVKTGNNTWLEKSRSVDKAYSYIRFATAAKDILREAKPIIDAHRFIADELKDDDT